MLQINAEKMSKSLGNFLLLHDVLEATRPGGPAHAHAADALPQPARLLGRARWRKLDAALVRIENAVRGPGLG